LLRFECSQQVTSKEGIPVSNRAPKATDSPSKLELLGDKFEEVSRFPQRIRRCFMNGRQCIFCGQASLVEERGFGGVFVIMPFRPAFDTFYEWSLKPYIKEGLGLDEKQADQISRADAFAEVGSIMCKKICLRIQEAELIVADLSTDNPNVLYELGMAVGLNKPLLLIADETCAKKRAPDFWQSLGAQENDVVKYPNVGFLDHKEHGIVPSARLVDLGAVKPEMKIVTVLSRHDAGTVVGDKVGSGASPSASEPSQDIAVTFSQAVRGALGVAVVNIDSCSEDSRSPIDLRRAVETLKTFQGQSGAGRNARDLGIIAMPESLILGDLGNNDKWSYTPYDKIAKEVDSAFVCIVDLADENPHAYFWLGYCHARGINVIPIYRQTKDEDKTPTAVLAFDIRSLYYIHFRRTELRRLAESLHGALQELVTRDVPQLQRNIFWERLTRDERIHICTGAVHHEGLDREVVGDWDQRIVSELVRHLASTDQSVIPQLESPAYSPQTIRTKLGERWGGPEYLAAYVERIKATLCDKNCIIIASADVNALTEVVLAHAYNRGDACFTEFPKTLTEVHGSEPSMNSLVVVIKPPKEATGTDNAKEEDPIPTYFSAYMQNLDTFGPGADAQAGPSERGFLVDNALVTAPYESQWAGSADSGGFSVLAQLVVMQNPFYRDPITGSVEVTGKGKDKTTGKLLVLLNGVSGPGTFGLAEVLTGGTDPNKAQKALDAELILKALNEKWEECKFKGTNRGVEAIIEVRIKPAAASPETGEQSDGRSTPAMDVEQVFYDRRQVDAWALVMPKPPKPDESEDAKPKPRVTASIRGGNPRSFPS